MRQFRHATQHALFGSLLGMCLVVGRLDSLGHGDTHEALKRINEAIAIAPQDASLVYDRAALYEQHGDFELALADLDHVVKLSPTDERCTALRARILCQAGRPGDAKVLQKAFLEKYPKREQVRFEYSRTLVALGEREGAIRELDVLIAAAEHPSPDVVAMRLELTESIRESGPSLALAWLNEFLEKHPLPVFQEAALRLEIKLGKSAEALRRLDFLAASAPRPETFLLRKAELLQSSGQIALANAAAKQAEQAISRLPDATRNSRAIQTLLQKVRIFLPTVSPP